jgi:hypothetical protein
MKKLEPGRWYRRDDFREYFPEGLFIALCKGDHEEYYDFCDSNNLIANNVKKVFILPPPPEDPLVCPVCGKEVEIETIYLDKMCYEWMYRINCSSDTTHRTTTADSREEAIRRWNA